MQKKKTGGRRVLFPLKRANIAICGLYDRAAGRGFGHALGAGSPGPETRNGAILAPVVGRDWTPQMGA
jgi:hypothetical protein